eukprot:4323694-Prymnesium_polylepis.1
MAKVRLNTQIGHIESISFLGVSRRRTHLKSVAGASQDQGLCFNVGTPLEHPTLTPLSAHC